MPRTFPAIAFVLALAACSQDRTAQAPAESGKPPATAQADATRPAAPAQPPGTPPPARAAAPVGAPTGQQSSASTQAPSGGAGLQPGPPAQDDAARSGSAASDAAAGSNAEGRVADAKEQSPPVPQFREITIPAGTALTVQLATAVSSDASQVEDEVRGTLAKAVVVKGVTAIPAGADVIGAVRSAKRSGRVKGVAAISFRFDRLVIRDEPVTVQTALVSRQATVSRREDVTKGAIGGAAGAIVGGLIGGGKGAAIGAGVGGTGAVVATRGREVRLEPGTIVRTTLQQPIEITVPR